MLGSISGYMRRCLEHAVLGAAWGDPLELWFKLGNLSHGDSYLYLVQNPGWSAKAPNTLPGPSDVVPRWVWYGFWVRIIVQYLLWDPKKEVVNPAAQAPRSSETRAFHKNDIQAHCLPKHSNVSLIGFHTVIDISSQNAPTGRLAGLSVQQKHVDAQKMLYFTVFLALEGS